MKHRVLTTFLAIGTALSLVPGCSRQPAGRFIVLVIMDTVRRDTLGCYGDTLGTTPHIDALAADGVRFERAISSSGWTLPAVASILTSNWPSIHGALGRGAKLTPVRPEVTMAAEAMRGAGFHTAGYANAAFVSPALGIDRGFDVFDHEYSYKEDSRRADATVDLAVAYARDHRAEPTFMMIHLFDATLDYDPPDGYRTRFTDGRSEPEPPLGMEDCLGFELGDSVPSARDIRYVEGVYRGEVAFADAQIGRFIATLKELGLYERAFIVVTADHGEEFWDHGEFEHGHTLYDELVRVPLVVKLPADVHPASHRVPWQVRTIDIMPTVFDYLGIPAPETFAGKSLMEYVRGEPTGPRNAFSESILYGTRKVAWRNSRYTYIQDIEEGRDSVGELYDWKNDPGEKVELAAAEPDMARTVRKECMDFYTGLLARARSMSPLEPVDMSPEEIRKLRSLGYIR